MSSKCEAGIKVQDALCHEFCPSHSKLRTMICWKKAKIFIED
jgi:hypothetical protein